LGAPRSACSSSRMGRVQQRPRGSSPNPLVERLHAVGRSLLIPRTRCNRADGRCLARSQANERALAPTTARIVLITLNQVCRFAVRRGWLAENPVSKLEPSEKPHWTPRRVAILEGEQLARFLAHAGRHRPLFELLAYTGLRIGEALGLTWSDIDFDAGLIRVHRQLSRRREHAPLKTEAGRREVVLAPAVAKLREEWLASSFK